MNGVKTITIQCNMKPLLHYNNTICTYRYLMFYNYFRVNLLLLIEISILLQSAERV